MSCMKMNLAKELEGKGMYPFEGTYYGGPYPAVEKLNQPISPKENLLRYYRGEDFEWIPDLLSDQIDITPHCNVDVDACDYEGGYDAFGVKWIPVEGGMLPSFVEPGFKLLDDIADWKSLTFPEVDRWDWASYAAKYNETYQNDDRLRRGILLSGYFERLISIMGFEEAAVSMLTDPESVEEFFNELTKVNIQIMKHYIEDFGCQSIMIHDDWSSQRAPFFSVEIVEELLVPQLKKLVDYAHERNVIFTLHSCGNAQMLIPAMIAAGVDAWQAQYDALDLDAAYEACGDDLIFESYPEISEEIRGAELEAYIRETLEKFCVKHKGLLEFYDFDEERVLETRKLIYKIGRELAVEGKAK